MSQGIQTIPKGAYCLNYIKVKTSICTGTTDTRRKQQQFIISHVEYNVHKNLSGVLTVWYNCIYIKTISTLGKTMGNRLIGSTLLIGKYNDNPRFM